MRLYSPAKINLFLNVTSKRPDDYHELVTIMCRVSLYDEINISPRTGKTSVSCSHPDVPEDATNLVIHAADSFFKTMNRHEHIHISIDKKIPVGAGLGGGSSNAATVLSWLNRFYGNPLSREKLIALGLSIGADVPFFIFQQPAMASGIGEKLEPFENIMPFPVILVFPGFSVSTGEVFKKMNLRLTKCEKKLKKILLEKKRCNIMECLCNDLETVTVSMYPVISSIKNSLLNLGASAALMTGSGPTVFGLFQEHETARKAQAALTQNRDWQVFLADLLV